MQIAIHNDNGQKRYDDISNMSNNTRNKKFNGLKWLNKMQWNFHWATQQPWSTRWIMIMNFIFITSTKKPSARTTNTKNSSSRSKLTRLISDEYFSETKNKRAHIFEWKKSCLITILAQYNLFILTWSVIWKYPRWSYVPSKNAKVLSSAVRYWYSVCDSKQCDNEFNEDYPRILSRSYRFIAAPKHWCKWNVI